MRIVNPVDWVLNRFEVGKSVFATRLNDGDMISMYRTRPEGSLLGTDANPAYTHYDLGDAFWKMLEDMSESNQDIKDSIMIGCSCGTERADDMARRFERDVKELELANLTWANEHWALDGVVDGSTIRLLDYIRQEEPTVLVTCKALSSARYCLDAFHIECSSEDSWKDRDGLVGARGLAEVGCTFIWCAGTGLKPTAWKLYKEFPNSSHIDLGHLFNGSMGFFDYGWLKRGDGPWYAPYIDQFVPYVRSFIKS